MKTDDPHLGAALVLAAAIIGLANSFSVEAGETQKPPLRVAVLDLQTPKASPWLGPAVSESLAAKLAGVDGLTLVEREQVQAILLAKQDAEPTPELLGADFLITGSVQLIGTWPDKAAQVRLTTKVVASETAKLNADAATIIDGSVGKLFALESDLAEQIARSMGLEPTRLQIDYHEERSTQAKQLFGEGLLALQQAERRIPTAGAAALPSPPTEAKTTPKEKAEGIALTGLSPNRAPADAAAPDAVGEAEPLLQSAIQLFRQAQQANDGAFFARAHHYEARARELLAHQQQDDDQRRLVREKTIKQFRQDAADAAPAFFDLGRALQANGQYEQAIQAYQSYLQWHDESERTLLWEGRWHNRLTTESGPGFFAHGLRERNQRYDGNSSPADMYRAFKVESGRVFYCDTPETLACADLSTGKIIWSEPVPAVGEGDSDTRCLVVRAKRIYFASCRHIQVFDRDSGQQVHLVETRLSEDMEKRARLNSFGGPLYLFVFEEQDRLVVGNHRGLLGYELSTGNHLWFQDCPDGLGATAAVAFDGQIYRVSLHAKGLVCVDPLTGEHRLASAVPDDCHAQIWPGEDHLLLRKTRDIRRAEGDLYLQFNWRKSACWESTERIFFSPFHMRPPDDAAVIPIMDEEAGIYRLLPSRLLYPLNVVEAIDHESGIVIPRTDLPWVTLSNDDLWIWRDEILHRLNATTGELKWKKWVPRSCSGVDADGDVAVLRTGSGLVALRAGREENVRIVQAHLHIAANRQHLGQMAGAVDSLRQAVRAGAGEPEPLYAMSVLQQSLGNTAEAIEYANQVVRLASRDEPRRKRALEYLRKTLGMKEHYRLRAPWVGALDDRGIFLRQSDDDQNEILLIPPTGSRTPVSILRSRCNQWWLQDDWIYSLQAGRLFPKTEFGDFGDDNPPRHEDVQAILERRQEDTVVWRCPATGGPADPIVRFGGFDNRFHDGLGYLSENVFVAGIEDETLIAYDLRNGDELWRRKFAAPYLVLRSGHGRLIACEARTPNRPNHRVWCLGLRTGEILWEQNLDIRLRPGIQWSRNLPFTLTQEGSRSIPDVVSHLIDFSNEDVWILPVYYREDKSSAPYWSDPRPPLYRLDLNTGQLTGREEFDDRVLRSHVVGGRVVYSGWRWSYSRACPGSVFLLDSLPGDRLGPDSDFRVSVDDFWETDPRLLASFPPLAGLAGEWDLRVQAERLNRLLEDHEQRLSLIRTFAQRLGSRDGGAEPAICRVQSLLTRGDLTEAEEKFLARQTMTLWRGHEPDVHLRLYHPRTTLRGESPVFLKPDSSGIELVLADNFGRFSVFDAAPPRRRISQLRCQPQLSPEQFRQMLLHENDLVVTTRQDDLYTFEAGRLVRFMLDLVQQDRGAFAVAQAKLPIGNAFDGDPQTICTAEPEDEPIAIGFDFAYPRAVNRIELMPAPGTESHLVGAMLQASERSETGGFRVLHLIREAPKPGETLTIQLEKPETARWFRLVVPAGQPLAVADLAFEYDAPTYDGVEEADAAPPPQPGLKRTVFHGTWDNLPDFAKLKPAEIGVARSITLDGVEPKDNFGLCFDGWIRITTPGEYAFHLTSDDGSRLLLHDALLIDNDGTHAMVEKSALVKLTPGLHPIRIEFFEKGGGESLQLEWTTPDSGREPVPADVLFHRQEVPVSP